MTRTKFELKAQLNYFKPIQLTNFEEKTNTLYNFTEICTYKYMGKKKRPNDLDNCKSNVYGSKQIIALYFPHTQGFNRGAEL